MLKLPVPAILNQSWFGWNATVATVNFGDRSQTARRTSSYFQKQVKLQGIAPRRRVSHHSRRHVNVVKRTKRLSSHSKQFKNQRQERKKLTVAGPLRILLLTEQLEHGSHCRHEKRFCSNNCIEKGKSCCNLWFPP